ncbi:MAG TPA: DUF4129 domain-containing protein [Burkholderiales bacterium]|nr:DUF4129 domain-containing protein [Burkholderiales bacterium]
MRAEDVAVRLRPRNPWEAMDLGFAMARRWSLPIWGGWFAVCLPTVLALSLAFRASPWLAALVLWWLKPLFDRFVLHVTSRAVFGTAPSVASTLGAWREILSPGLFGALTLHRFDLARSFLLPVWQLERQTGREARARRTTLQRRTRSYAVWLTLICVNVEALVLISAGLLLDLFKPSEVKSGLDLLESLRGAGGAQGWSWPDTLAYAIAMSAIEPLYVAAGFSLYLNRRMTLEAWDIELGLRRLSERFSAPAATLGAIVLGLVLSCATPGRGALASPAAPKQEIAKILATPEFSTQRETTHWRYRGSGRAQPQDHRPAFGNDDFTALGRLLAKAVQIAGWLALAVLLVVAVAYAARLLPAPAPPRAAPTAARAPAFHTAPRASLPSDIAGAAAALLAAGKPREALSLLYRGALAALARRYRLEIGAAETEGECVARARGALPALSLAYFDALVQVWGSTAYAAQPPDAARTESLCRDWNLHFGPGAEVAR